MFSRDEMQRAIEDALKSMEGVALELYRRGREESREELETVTRERDEARANYQWMVDRACNEKLDGYRELATKCAQLEEERDEARAEAERWKRSCNVFRERDWPHAFQVTVTRLEREVSDAHDQLAKLRRLSKPWEGGAYQRGAEAMREACAMLVLTSNAVHGRVDADALRALPIPEDL